MQAASCFKPSVTCLAVLFVAAAVLSGCGEKPARTVVFEDFEANAESKLSARLMSHTHLAVVPHEGVSDSSALRATYVGYPRGSERIAFSYPLGEQGLEYTLSFDVRFCENFQFVRGGKLHGLGPAHPVTGGHQGAPDTWSARLMFEREGGLRTYVYHQGQQGRYGDSVRARHFRFVPGQYHAIDFQVRLNTPSHADNGSITVHVDGRRVIRHEGIRFRGADTPDALISTLLFSTFHGGNTPDWAPRARDGGYAVVCADFDNLAVSRGLVVKQPGSPWLAGD